METHYTIDDFAQYQGIHIIEDVNVKLKYCRIDEVRCLAKLIKAFTVKNVLEIGTQAGMTTCYLSRNLPPDGVLYTIDITNHMQAAEDVLDVQRPEILTADQVGWYYRAHDCKNVVQIIGDSRVFNYKDAGIREIDLCFIDGNHTSDAVYQDVVNVLQYMHNGSCLVWHDFYGITSPDKGVKGAISKLLSDRILKPPIFTIADTWLAYTIL